MRRTSSPDPPSKWMSMFNGAFLARANISEMNPVFGEMLEIVAHNDESSSATRRQNWHTCVALIQPRFCSVEQAGSSSTRKWKTRARISGGRMKIGVRALRRAS